MLVNASKVETPFCKTTSLVILFVPIKSINLDFKTFSYLFEK